MVEIEMNKKSWVTFFALWLFVENRRWDVGRRKKKYCDKIGSCLKTKEYQNWKPSFIVTSFLVAKTNAGKSGGRQTFKSGKHEIHINKNSHKEKKIVFCFSSKSFFYFIVKVYFFQFQVSTTVISRKKCTFM